MNIAVVFAKGPEAGKRNINLYLVENRPLIYYSINAALKSGSIGATYVATDSKDISDIAEGSGCKVIERSSEKESGGMGVAIVYVVRKILEGEKECENIILLAGNTVMISPYLIEKSIDVLNINSQCRSVLTVWKARHDNPAYAITLEKGEINPVCRDDAIRDVYYHDGCVCAFRKEVIDDPCFNDPRWWIKLPSCIFLARPWPTGRDVHDSYELSMSRWWVQNEVIDIAEEVR